MLRVASRVSTQAADSEAGSSVLDAHAIIQGPPDKGTVTMYGRTIENALL